MKQLGIEGIWLMPINPSPSYHGYDVTDYYKVNPDYGTIEDYRDLLKAAHERDIIVIMDLVVNHTSVGHPWFQSAAKGKDSPYRNWYTWAEDANLTASGASAKGGTAWHEKDGNHYLGVFWQGMPDLNFDHPDVRKKMIKIGNFWLKQGVDGFRLDAAKHIYEDFQTSKADKDISKKNQAWWQEFRKGLDTSKGAPYIVGEVWDSTSVISPYLNRAFDSSFNFDLSDMIISAARSEKSSNFAGTCAGVIRYSKRNPKAGLSTRRLSIITTRIGL
ncbi:alpha-amylase family glycosyl hydrolase [Paenibacillus sedimenti]|uniref:Glycosyl hydrolase family 13 catalytic domain-containing protein n=1 Tax=Paenibacillus sedimenti TaxID=2770274 RepID=A0A926KNP1_9BACL|nr:alpha-amylase family glycosyl hydrolase [Paenibacillus sedimenti]MBD0380091.1 hypothetical protein [Paenibacillus sedimenti]